MNNIDNKQYYGLKEKSQNLTNLMLKILCKVPRRIVSQNKRRYVKNGFDLDLAYIAPQIIVMGFPSVGIEVCYRNPRLEIIQFLESNHKSHYKIFNFCSEKNRWYNPSEFSCEVVNCPFEDHNVPSIRQLVDFGENARSWLRLNPENVVVLHCKAGKGRAGLMACVLLLRMGICCTAKEAIFRYNEMRVQDMQGLTVISQKKWVKYYEKLLERYPGAMIEKEIIQKVPSYLLEKVTLVNTLTTPPLLCLRIYRISDDLNDLELGKKILILERIGEIKFDIGIYIYGSLLFEFCLKNCTCWNWNWNWNWNWKWNWRKYIKTWCDTRFFGQGDIIEIQRDEIDGIRRDIKYKKFPMAFKINLHITRQP